jgi:hypothetical protein
MHAEVSADGRLVIDIVATTSLVRACHRPGDRHQVAQQFAPALAG